MCKCMQFSCIKLPQFSTNLPEQDHYKSHANCCNCFFCPDTTKHNNKTSTPQQQWAHPLFSLGNSFKIKIDLEIPPTELSKSKIFKKIFGI